MFIVLQSFKNDQWTSSFLGLLDTVHATLIGFLDVTASTVLLRVISSQILPLNQTEAIDLTNFLELFNAFP